MLNLKKVFKSYSETGPLNEQVNLYGFVDPHAFLTKSGDVGVILQVHGVDHECLDPNSLDTLTKRLESALKMFDENFRIYQYLFKRNNEPIPYKKYASPIVNTAIENRIRHFAEKSERLYSLQIFHVVVFEGFRYKRALLKSLTEFHKNPKKALEDLRAAFSSRKQVVLLDREVTRALAFYRIRSTGVSLTGSQSGPVADNSISSSITLKTRLRFPVSSASTFRG